MNDELEMVTSFGDLNKGDRIVDLNCAVCGRPMCVATLERLDTSTYSFPCWFVGDPCRDDRPVGVTPFAIAERRIFRMRPRAAPWAHETAHPKKLERVR